LEDWPGAEVCKPHSSLFTTPSVHEIAVTPLIPKVWIGGNDAVVVWSIGGHRGVLIVFGVLKLFDIVE
jgi:hypothetical protein